MSDDLVKRLREGDQFEKVMSASSAADRIEADAKRIAELVADFNRQVERTDEQRAAYEARIAELEAALRPFVEIAKDRVADAPEWQDSDSVAVILEIGDLRAALEGEK